MKGKIIRIRSTMFSFSLNIFGSDLRKYFGYDDEENKEQHKLDRQFIRDIGKIYRKKLSVFDSWSMKNKSRVMFYVE